MRPVIDMAQLGNPRHERFAQGVAEGLSGAEAYRRAGFQPRSDATARSNACRLLTNDNIQARIDELRAETAAVCGIIRQTIVNYLRACIARAMETGQIKVALKAIDKLAEYTGIAPLVGDGAEQIAPAASAKTLSIAERIAATGGALSVIEGDKR